MHRTCRTVDPGELLDTSQMVKTLVDRVDRVMDLDELRLGTVKTLVDRVDRVMALDELRVGMVKTLVDRVNLAMALKMVLGDSRVYLDGRRGDLAGPLPRALHHEPGARACRDQRDDDQEYRGPDNDARGHRRDATAGCREVDVDGTDMAQDYNVLLKTAVILTLVTILSY